MLISEIPRNPYVFLEGPDHLSSQQPAIVITRSGKDSFLALHVPTLASLGIRAFAERFLAFTPSEKRNHWLQQMERAFRNQQQTENVPEGLARLWGSTETLDLIERVFGLRIFDAQVDRRTEQRDRRGEVFASPERGERVAIVSLRLGGGAVVAQRARSAFRSSEPLRAPDPPASLLATQARRGYFPDNLWFQFNEAEKLHFVTFPDQLRRDLVRRHRGLDVLLKAWLEVAVVGGGIFSSLNLEQGQKLDIGFSRGERAEDRQYFVVTLSRLSGEVGPTIYSVHSIIPCSESEYFDLQADLVMNLLTPYLNFLPTPNSPPLVRIPKFAGAVMYTSRFPINTRLREVDRQALDSMPLGTRLRIELPAREDLFRINYIRANPGAANSQYIFRRRVFEFYKDQHGAVYLLAGS